MSDIIPNLENMTDAEKKAALDAIQVSIAKSKEVQKQRIGENVGLVVDALKKIESDIRSRFDEVGNAIEKRVATIKDGRDGINGKDGRNGKDGLNGKQGVQGTKGQDGRDGRDGVDGVDGISVTSAHIDFDGSLIIGLSSGVELNVGEVIAPSLAESIKVITNGGGTSQSVIDTLASLQTQITNLIPSQTGNSGKFLTTNGTALSWANVAGGLSYQGTWNASTNTPTLTSSVGTNGYYYITATAGSTNLNGITDWQIGDWLMFNGTVWQKIDQSNLVTSVAGRTGAITLSNTDISGLGTISTQASSNVSITGGSITGITDLAVADGGTGSSTAQGAINTLAGAVTSGSYLRGNGTNVVMNTIQATDVPTLNQNTTGTSANVTGIVNVINGGTGSTGFNGLAKASGSLQAYSAATSSDVLSTIGTVPIANGGTGLTTTPANGALDIGNGTGFTRTTLTGTASQVVVTNASGSITLSLPSTINVNTSGSAASLSATLAIASGGTGQTTANTAFNALAPSQTSNSGKYLTTDGTNSSWATVVSGASISNDTTTSSNLYPLFAAATSGVPTTIYTGNAKYLYKPSTGELTAPALISSNGININSATVSASYTIASGNNGMSVGPITVATGQSVTVSSGQRWVVL
jgi:hypothetical protein